MKNLDGNTDGYGGGRNAAWVKTKCNRRDEFVVVGWQPSASRGRPSASLLLGAFEGETLIYCGKVGTGWDEHAMKVIAARLAGSERKTAPLAAPDEVDGARWVEPRLASEFAYAERIPRGLLRHARFVARREDKPATEVEDPPRAKMRNQQARARLSRASESAVCNGWSFQK